MTTIGILHPGEMGSEVGASARAGGARVVWASGRGGTFLLTTNGGETWTPIPLTIS